ncbi:MAG TPA: sigma factor-like helix-turn-helix DNA-binding protein [Nitrospira sp.]|nr:sigma factor-like helix-turn-helix DNA-binding protein [Nitrospira sp.]
MLLNKVGYSRKRVRYLSEGYRSLRHMKDTKPGRPLSLLVELVDLDIAQQYLTDDEYVTWLMCGICGYTTREAAEFLGVSHMTVSRRYDRAIEVLKSVMNNDDQAM